MRALIVDDEPVARRVLCKKLEPFEDIEIIGEAENGAVALRQIQDLHPHLVFLDLQMPVMDGFGTISRLQGPSLPAIIILTAYDEFAISAFEAGAIDYLLKPVKPGRLRQSIERARRLLHQPSDLAEQLAQLHSVASPLSSRKFQKIVGKYHDEYFLLNPNDILAFRADGELTWIVTSERRYLATQNLKALEKKLQGSSLCRTHRGALINIDQITKNEHDNQPALASDPE